PAQQVDDRIKAALADGGWPDSDLLQNIFSGNVIVQDTVYPPRTQILSVIQDAADAEFPDVANFFMSKDGKATFHGRLARFNPSAYGLGSWACGDLVAFNAASGTTALISSLLFARDKKDIINAAMATPQGIQDPDIRGQFAFDVASLETYGVNSWSAENLLTRSEDVTGLDAATAT